MNWIDFIIKTGSVIGSISVITAFVGKWLITFYKKTVTEPMQENSKELQEGYTNAINASIAPLTQSIELLNHNLQESQQDRENIHGVLDEHEYALIDHDKRISFLERKKGEVAHGINHE